MIWFIPAAGFVIGIFAASKKAAGNSFFSNVFGPFQIFGPPMQSNIDAIAFEKAKAIVREEEGYRKDVYLDSEGKLTVGIGHLVLPSDNLVYGQVISAARVDEFFAQDIAKAFSAAKKQALEARKYTPDFIAALTSVNFQLGTGWTKVFYNTWKDIKAGNISSAISRLNQSDWKKQTPDRVAYFVSVLQQVYT